MVSERQQSVVYRYKTKIKINPDRLEAHVSKMKSLNESVEKHKTMEENLHTVLYLWCTKKYLFLNRAVNDDFVVVSRHSL